MLLRRIDKLMDVAIEIAQGLILLLAISICILLVATIAYGLWESIAGSFFHIDRNAIAILTAIAFCGMQFKHK